MPVTLNSLLAVTSNVGEQQLHPITPASHLPEHALQVTYISGPLYGCQAISQPHKKLDIIRKQGFEALPHLQMLRVLDVDNR